MSAKQLPGTKREEDAAVKYADWKECAAFRILRCEDDPGMFDIEFVRDLEEITRPDGEPKS